MSGLLEKAIVAAPTVLGVVAWPPIYHVVANVARKRVAEAGADDVLDAG